MWVSSRPRRTSVDTPMLVSFPDREDGRLRQIAPAERHPPRTYVWEVGGERQGLRQALGTESRRRRGDMVRNISRAAAVAAVIVAAIVVSVVTAGPVSAATPDPKLLARYQPVTNFDPAEQFGPTSVQSFITDSSLERFDGTNWVVTDQHPGPGNLPGAGNRHLATEPAALHAVVCARRDSTATPTPGTTALAPASSTDASPTKTSRRSSSTGSSTTTTSTRTSTRRVTCSGRRTRATGRSSTSFSRRTNSRYSSGTANTASASNGPGPRLPGGTGRIRSCTSRPDRTRTTSRQGTISCLPRACPLRCVRSSPVRPATAR